MKERPSLPSGSFVMVADDCPLTELRGWTGKTIGEKQDGIYRVVISGLRPFDLDGETPTSETAFHLHEDYLAASNYELRWMPIKS